MDDIFVVDRDEYIGFVDQIKPEARQVEQEEHGAYNVIKTYSKITGKLFCEHYVPQEEGIDEIFKVYEMPEDDERREPPRKFKVELQTKEEVKTFLEILNKLQKQETKR